jgi:O-antigen/teichoic acid export membrane protein
MNADLRAISTDATNDADARLSATSAAANEIQSAVDQGSDARWLARNSAIVLGGSFAGQGLQFSIQVLLARMLGPADFGLYGIGWTLMRLVGPFATLGLNSGVIYGASNTDPSDRGRLRDVLLQSVTLGLLAGGAVGAAAYIFAPELSGVFGKGELTAVIRGFALALPLLTGLAVAGAATKLSMSMFYSACAESFTQPGLNLLFLAVALYFLQERLTGAIAAVVASYALSLLLALYFMFNLFWPTLRSPGQMKSYVGELLAFSLPASIAASFANLIVRVDRLMIGALMPATEVGIYHAASQASIVFAIIPFIFNNVIAPRVSDLYARGEIKRLDELFKLGAKWSFYLAMPLFLAVCSAPGGIMKILYGGPYQRGAWPLLILCAGLMSDAIIGAAPTILIFSGHQKSMGAISASALVSTIILNYLLIPRFGMIGGAISAFLPEVGMLFAFLLAVKKLVGIWPYDRRWFKGLGAAVCAGIALWLLHGWMGASAELAPVRDLIVAGGIFWGVILLCGLDHEDKEFLWPKR